MPMIIANANNLAYVNTSCTHVAHLTSQQLTNVKITRIKNNQSI